ncbi:hypothetical protein [Psychroserpens sp. MEBiC05023]
MREIIITAEILFFELAKERFNFPIVNTIRTSFWLLESNQSTFSEILMCSKRLDVGIKSLVRIKLLEQEFLQDKIKEDVDFQIGIFPEVIAKGKILKVE